MDHIQGSVECRVEEDVDLVMVMDIVDSQDRMVMGEMDCAGRVAVEGWDLPWH